MSQLTHDQYDRIERAVMNGTRVLLRRKGKREYVLIPLSLRIQNGREAIEARHPTTGHDLTIFLDEVDAVELVG